MADPIPFTRRRAPPPPSSPPGFPAIAAAAFLGAALCWALFAWLVA